MQITVQFITYTPTIQISVEYVEVSKINLESDIEFSLDKVSESEKFNLMLFNLLQKQFEVLTTKKNHFLYIQNSKLFPFNNSE